MVTGTHYEPNKIKEVSQKLGQYVFVLMAQRMDFQQPNVKP
jgi:hypothetical protein